MSLVSICPYGRMVSSWTRRRNSFKHRSLFFSSPISNFKQPSLRLRSRRASYHFGISANSSESGKSFLSQLPKLSQANLKKSRSNRSPSCSSLSLINIIYAKNPKNIQPINRRRKHSWHALALWYCRLRSKLRKKTTFLIHWTAIIRTQVHSKLSLRPSLRRPSR